CPWEGAEPQLEKRTVPGKDKLPPRELSRLREKGSKDRDLKAEICPWEVQEAKSFDKAQICPWEGAEPQVEKGTVPGKDKLPPRELSRLREKGSKDRESICSWERLDTEQPPGKARAWSTALPK
ncbi:GP179 protein, partial [Grallaria varia]|nr:GP179 protein [Grallaria varia]